MVCTYHSFCLSLQSPPHLRPHTFAVLCEMFILFWIGRTVAYRGKHSSTLTFLCVVITEQTARLLAGLHSLALFLPSLSLFLQAIFVVEKYLHFSVAFPLVCSLIFQFVKSIKGFLGSLLHLWFSAAQRSIPG